MPRRICSRLPTPRPGWDEDGHGLTMAREKARVRRAFWPKLRPAGLAFAEVLVAACFCAFDQHPMFGSRRSVRLTTVRSRSFPAILRLVVFTDGALVLATAIRLAAVHSTAPSGNRAPYPCARPHPRACPREPSRRIGRGRRRCAWSSGPHRVDCRIFATHARYPPRQSDDTYELDEWP
jgi:hypothetical protein